MPSAPFVPALLLQASRRVFALEGAHVLMLFISALVTILCVVVHYEVMSWSSRYLARLGLPRRMRIVALIFALLAAHVVEIWIFGLTLWVLDAWPSLGTLHGEFDEGAFDFIYFSATVFSTLGFGDIVPQGPVRILTGTESLVGLSLITWSASLAFLEMQRDWAEYRSAR